MGLVDLLPCCPMCCEGSLIKLDPRRAGRQTLSAGKHRSYRQSVQLSRDDSAASVWRKLYYAEWISFRRSLVAHPFLVGGGMTSGRNVR